LTKRGRCLLEAVQTAALVAAAAVITLVAPAHAGSIRRQAEPVFGYRVVASWPHDPQAYTEGLALDGGFLYESTGLNGLSTLRKVDFRTGRVLRSVRLANRYFGEGMTVFQGRVYLVTWLQQTGFVFDRASLRRLSTFSYQGEGWGLTHYGKLLVLSDGSDVLRFLDPTTFAVRRTITVRDDQGAGVASLNELEAVAGAICANVFTTDRIVCVDPASGRVRYWIDIGGLLPPSLRSGDETAVSNGIAYGGHPGRLLVTGKLWPRIFEIRLVPKK
jgi:glutamine cyclotransferase